MIRDTLTLTMVVKDFSYDADLEISLNELEYIEAKFAAEKSSGKVSEDTQFVYAWALIRSRYRDDRLLGIQELEDIIKNYPSRKRECCYYLASANYKIGEYKAALRFINELLISEPNNPQALDLKSKIEKKLTNDGVLGLAVAGGLAAATVGIMLVMFRSKRK